MLRGDTEGRDYFHRDRVTDDGLTGHLLLDLHLILSLFPCLEESPPFSFSLDVILVEEANCEAKDCSPNLQEVFEINDTVRVHLSDRTTCLFDSLQ